MFGKNSFAYQDAANTGLDSGLAATVSDYVARVSYQPDQTYTFISRFRFAQQDFTVEKVVARMNEILPFGPARDKMIEGLASVKLRLRGPAARAVHPIDRAAEMVLGLLQGRLASRIEATAR